jgi:hypothetical protein
LNKLLYKFDFSWQAGAAAEELQRQGIPTSTISRPREYASIITGGVADPMDIYVSEADHERAAEILNKLQNRNALHVVSEDNVGNEKNYFRRVIIFSLFGVISLPLLFNWVASENYKLLRKQKNISVGKQQFALFFLVLGWLIAIVEIFVIFSKTHWSASF